MFLNGMGKLFSKSSSDKHKSKKNYNPTEPPCSQQSTFHQMNPIHSEPVTSLDSVSNEICLSGSKDQRMCAFNVKQCCVQSSWTGHTSEVTKVACGPVKDLYFSASRDTTIKAWRTGSGQPVRSYLGHELVVTGLSVNSENSRLVSGSRDNTVRVWDVETGAQVLMKDITRNLVTHVKWAANCDLIAQTSEDKQLRIFDSRSLTEARAFPPKQYIQTCCDLDPNGVYCVTSSNGFSGQGCEATLWDVRQCRAMLEYRGHSETVGSCVLVPGVQRSLVATCSSDSSVRLWDTLSGECVAMAILPASGPLTSLTVLHDNGQTRLCVGSFNLGITVLDLKQDSNGTFSLVKTLQF